MPTVNTGINLSFHDTEGIKRDVSDVILTLDPYDVPLLRWMPSTIKPVTNTKHEWLEDSLVPSVATCDGGIDASATTLVVPVHSGEGNYFKANDVIKVGSEVMLVASVSGDNITVAARGYGSSSPAIHANDAVVTRIGRATAEGPTASDPRTTSKTAGYNYTQIFEETVKVSGTREAIDQYGVASEYAYQLAKTIKERAIQVEQALIHGVRYEDTSAHRRTMGGLLEFISTNTVSASNAALTKARLDHLTHDIWRAGGNPRTMVMNIDQKAALYNIYENQIRVDTSERGLGGYIEYFVNDLGRFDILLDRWVPRDMILLIDRDKVGFSPLQGRDWSHTYMGQTGDFKHGQMVFEGTLEVRGEEAHGVITDLAYTA